MSNEQESKVEKGLETIPKMKVCNKCGEEKDLTAEFFHRLKADKFGFAGKCKDCRKKKRDSPEEVAKRKERYLNPAVTEKRKARRSTPEFKEQRRTKRKLPHNREKARKYENSPKGQEKLNRYREKEEYIENRKEYEKEYNKRPEVIKRKRDCQRKYSHTSKGKVKGAMRKILERIIEEGKMKKTGRTADMLGYTGEDLIQHLNKGEYTWTDYMKGGFSLDHIIPLNYFVTHMEVDDTGVPTERGLEWVKSANSLINLRVYPTKGNLSKHAKLDMELVIKHKLEHLL
jgi:hypothetical protein